MNQDGFTDLPVTYYTCSNIKTVSCPSWEVASSGAQITAVQVYIDNSLIYNDTSGATYVDRALTCEGWDRTRSQ